MITEVKGFLQQADRIVWGPWLIFLLLGCGCYLMISLRFLPLRNLLAALGLVFHSKSRKGTDGEGVSSFSALTTELAATIGTGNIVGVATAMVLGGPGASVLDAFVRDHRAVDQTGGKYAVCQVSCKRSQRETGGWSHVCSAKCISV